MSDTIIRVDADAVLQRRRNAFAKAGRWSKFLAKFVSIQIIVQALGLVTGLLLIRTLSQREYAYYTLANTMQATLLLLADVGIGNALSATGGKVWQDRRRFGELIQTGLHIRKSLAWIGGSTAVPVLAWMLHRNGASVLYTVLLIAGVLLGVNFRLTNDVLTVVPRLHARISQLQKLDLVASAFRVISVAAFFRLLDAAVGVLIGSLSFGVQYLLLRRWAADGADLKAPVNAEDRQTIWRVIRQMAPSTIYYCVQSQIMVFLLSIFGGTRMIAEVGALGRLAMLFSIISSVMTSVALPRFARCQDRARLTRMWWQIVGTYAALSVLMMLVAVWLPGPFLWLLGKQYKHLGADFGYVIFSTVVSNFVGIIYGLNSTRAWTKGAWIAIPIVIAMQILLIRFLDVSTIKGVALLSSLPFIVSVVPYLYRTYRSLQAMDAEMSAAKA